MGGGEIVEAVLSKIIYACLVIKKRLEQRKDINKKKNHSLDDIDDKAHRHYRPDMVIVYVIVMTLFIGLSIAIK